MQKTTVGVIFGGPSGEHDVSLMSAASVMSNLPPERYEVVPIGYTREGQFFSDPNALWMLQKEEIPQTTLSLGEICQELAIDIMFPVLHGPYGEDGRIQGALETLGIPYVGAGVLASAVGMDKISTKRILSALGLPQVPWEMVLEADMEENPGRVIQLLTQHLSLPMFVKPANMGSSVGITKVKKHGDLLAALTTALVYDRRVIVEEGLPDVREIECAILGNDKPEASVLGEIIPDREFYTYEAKYEGGSSLKIPAELPSFLTMQIQSLAKDTFLAIDGSGLARVDFFVTDDERVYINEINTMPGFTRYSMYPQLWEYSGVPYRELLARLLSLAEQRFKKRTPLRRK